jgi:hypothetical protein
MNKLLLSSFLIIISIGTHSDAAPLTDDQIREIGYTYPTPFGNLKFYDENGQLGSLSARIELNSKLFFTPSPRPDGWGNSLSLMSMDTYSLTAIDTFPRAEKKLGRRTTKRLIVAEARDGNCIRQFVILDFTLDKPFVSERFGYNPEMKYCLTFKRAKWGVKESRITLNDGTYIYTTGADIIPPEEQ